MSQTGGPDWCSLLANWWGEGGPSQVILWATNASGIILGGNPPYQASDFLAFFPKFGSYSQSIASGGVSTDAGGTGYQVGDVVNVVQPDASGATLQITAVDGGGAVTAFNLITGGTGYSVATGLVTSSGHGTGFTVDITAIAPAAVGPIPIYVIQLYINLAQACLQKNLWNDHWMLGMHLFVAHYCTLWLRSEGGIDPQSATAAQIASSGLEKGVLISKSANDVSGSIELPKIEGNWGAWMETTYGMQLITIANNIGPQAQYVY